VDEYRLLFGELEFDRWFLDPPAIPDSADWATVRNALGAHFRNERLSAIRQLKQLLQNERGDTRAQLMGWTLLRSLGIQPPRASERRVLGVVFELGFPAGAELLAAYENMNVYYTRTGDALQHRIAASSGLRARILQLMDFAGAVIRSTEQDVNPPSAFPLPGLCRVSVLTPRGRFAATALTDNVRIGHPLHPVIWCVNEIRAEIEE
jgi:hypothetical protein